MALSDADRKGGVADVSSQARKVLIADDHKAFGMMVSAVVRAGFSTDVAVVQSVDAALAAVEMQPPDFLLADLRFGTVFGGLELIRAVRAHKRFEMQTLPILVLSANADLATVKQAQSLGVNDFVGKPVSPAVLLKRLHAMEFACARTVSLPIEPEALDL